MKLLVVRHGQTDANAQKILQGSRLDLPLNEVGLRQARGVLSLLKDESVDVIYSSQLKRAHQTAGIIAEALGLQIQTTELLKEKDFGELTGKSWDQIQEELGKENLYQADREHQYDYRELGGESVDQVKERINAFIEQVKENHPTDATILAVTHGGIVRLLHHMLEIELPPHIDNASLHKFVL